MNKHLHKLRVVLIIPWLIAYSFVGFCLFVSVAIDYVKGRVHHEQKT